MGREIMIRSYDGTELYLKIKDVPNAKAAVVFSHGLCEHQGKYEWLAKQLGENRLMGYFFDHRGHGRSQGRRAFYQNDTETLEDVCAVMDYAIRDSKKLPVFLIGHSMGGYAAACFGTAYPGKAAGIVLCSALTRYHTPCAGSLPIEKPPETIHPNLYEAGVYDETELVEALKDDPYLGREITVGLLNSIYYGVKWLKLHSKNFTDPVLILHGEADGLVSPQDSVDLYRDIASADKELILYNHFHHELLNGPQKNKMAENILRWINKKLDTGDS